MRKPAFLSNERLSRFLVSILLTMGLLLPLMFTFEAGSALALAIASATAVTVLCTALGTLRRGRLVLGIVGGALLAVQLVLPHMGLIGWAMEAFKAVSLYLNGVTAAAPLFARQLGLTLGVTVAGISYLFSSRNVGFLPATILVVLMLFGMWSLCQAEHLWFATPALVALLLLVSQTSHEKSNLFQVLPLAVAVVALGHAVASFRTDGDSAPVMTMPWSFARPYRTTCFSPIRATCLPGQLRLLSPGQRPPGRSYPAFRLAGDDRQDRFAHAAARHLQGRIHRPDLAQHGLRKTLPLCQPAVAKSQGKRVFGKHALRRGPQRKHVAG